MAIQQAEVDKLTSEVLKESNALTTLFIPESLDLSIRDISFQASELKNKVIRKLMVEQLVRLGCYQEDAIPAHPCSVFESRVSENFQMFRADEVMIIRSVYVPRSLVYWLKMLSSVRINADNDKKTIEWVISGIRCIEEKRNMGVPWYIRAIYLLRMGVNQLAEAKKS